MENEWNQRQFAAYGRDAELALRGILNGVQDRDYLEQCLGLLRTYLEACTYKIAAAPDEKIVRLALAIHQQVMFLGFWNEVATFWPHLRELARGLPEAIYFAEMTKQLALLLGRRGDSVPSAQLFLDLMTSPNFDKLPRYLQADILVSAGTSAVWNGALQSGERMLQRGLQISSSSETRKSEQVLTEIGGVRVSGTYMPWWENKAYALNQLGTLALFCGDFPKAHRYLDECLALFIAHGHADKLACVAYQGMGRILFHEGRYLEAKTFWQRGLAIRRVLQEEEGIATNLLYLSVCDLRLGDFATAERQLQKATASFQTLGNRLGQALSALYWGELEYRRGKVEIAFSHWQQSLQWMQTISTPFVEQRLFIKIARWLILYKKWRLLHVILRQLRQSIKQQKLQPIEVLRICRQKL